MSLSLAINGDIILDGHNTGLSLTQDDGYTRVFSVISGAPVRLPSLRYTLSADDSVGGVPGRAQLEADLRFCLK
ncbi:hypothetical protein [Bordetella petrii]|uniref:hypothetical protein n=1 Tax=Bordetella petrii TaxID=94624 RepID=UPI001E2E9D9F|nr:hypothetical protein [Bordetella petrii]MCD0502771.1 hypothetical protein [Bordetella petrii]